MYIEILNFALYAGFLYISFKRKYIAFLLYTAAIWTASAFMGIFYTQTNVYRDGMFKLSMEPFIFLFICFVISLYPFIKQRNEINHISYNNIRYLNIFSWSIIAVSLFPFIELCYRIFVMIQSGQFFLLGEMYESVSNGKEESLIQLSLTTTRLATPIKSLKVLSVVLLFYYLQQERINKYLIIGLIIVSFMPALFTLSIGGKTNLIYYILYIIGMYFFLRMSISKRNTFILKKLIISMIVLISIFTIALSIGRYVVSEKYDNSNFVMYLFQYFSESMFNFNENAYHTNKYLNGYYSSLPLLNDLNLTDVTVLDRRSFFSTKLNIPVHLFYTFIGMFYVDFGSIGCLLLLIISSVLFSKITKGGKISLPNLVLLSTYLYMIIQGLFYYCYTTSYAPVYANILFYIIAKFIDNKNVNKKWTQNV